jgi:hypothetical protein
MKNGALLGGLAVSHLALFGIGWAVAPKQAIDEAAPYDGFLRVDTTKVLEVTVQSLRAENKLLVFSYKGSAKVRAERTAFATRAGRYCPAATF